MNETITSLQNERVKGLVRLRDRKERVATGNMLVEEIRVIRRALAAGHPVHEAWFCPDLISDNDVLDQLRQSGVELVETSTPVMEKISYRNNPAGLLLVGELLNPAPHDLKLPNHPLLLVLHDVEKPGNLGAVLRTASGAGIDGVLIAGGADLGNPNTLRSSTGAVFTVPCAAGDPDHILSFLKERSVRLIATTPDTTTLHTDADLSGGIAIILGAEDTGLPDNWLEAADQRVRIPMHGTADSLNVSVAAAVLAYEAERQRRTAP
jgi:RNA methyltransferase, TrmH family